jgi:hypothetical protein
LNLVHTTRFWDDIHQVQMYFKIAFVLIINLAIVINRVRFMVLNATFNNISVISWRPVLFREETSIPGENHRLVASHWQHCIEYTSLWVGFVLTTLATDCIGSCKTFEVMTSPQQQDNFGSVASVLAATFHQEHHDRNHKL